MFRNVAQFALAALLAAACDAAPPGQNESWRIDADHSSASLYLGSSSNATSAFNVAIAKVSGKASLDTSMPVKSDLHLYIYPAGEASLLLARDGSFRSGAFADLARYTLMTFESKRATLAGDGKIEFTGDLTVTYVERPAAAAWNNAYDGTAYGEPVARSATREVTFVVETPSSAIITGQKYGTVKILASAAINRKDFPGLWTALRDSDWPVVVEDENCQMPQVRGSLRDYQGAVCTGTPILVETHQQTPDEFHTDYSGPQGTPGPAGDQVTIRVHLRLTS